jgi:FkbM family methyltransferase
MLGRTLARIWQHPANKDARVGRIVRYVAVMSFVRLARRCAPVRFGEKSKIFICPDNSSSSRVLRSPVPDWDEMQVWKRWLLSGDLFVDVGAHLGTYTIWACEAGAHVLAVEASDEMAEYLRQNLSLNGLDVEVWNVAVGAQPGRVSLTGADQSRRAIGEPTGAGDVEMRTLDSLVGDRHVAGLKIDVEGAERLVLDGARDLLSSGRVDLIQLEWNDMSQATLGEDRSVVAESLTRLGYVPIEFDADGNHMRTSWPPPEPGREVFLRRSEQVPGEPHPEVSYGDGS